jgi:trigger factor
VRLGLVLAEIGEKAGVQVDRRGDCSARCSRWCAATRRTSSRRSSTSTSNPNALTTLRAPIFEEKVVDHLLSQISVTDKKVTKEELQADDEAETDEKPTKKASAKKAASADSDAGDAPKKKAPAKKKTKDEE